MILQLIRYREVVALDLEQHKDGGIKSAAYRVERTMNWVQVPAGTEITLSHVSMSPRIFGVVKP